MLSNSLTDTGKWDLCLIDIGQNKLCTNGVMSPFSYSDRVLKFLVNKMVLFN